MTTATECQFEIFTHSYVLLIWLLLTEEEEKLVALPLLSYRCIVTINVLWLFFAVQWVGLWCVIVLFPDHTHLLFFYLFPKLESHLRDTQYGSNEGVIQAVIEYFRDQENASFLKG